MTWNYYDLWAGKQLTSADAALTVETDGYGGMLATPNTTANDLELAALLKTMSAFAEKSLASFEKTWHFEQGGIVDSPILKTFTATPAGMAKIPGGKYRFVAQGTEIEGAGSNYQDIGRGVDVQFKWEPRANRCAYRD